MKINLRFLLILLFFIGLSILWILIVPIPKIPPDSMSHFNPDEWNHIAIIKYYSQFQHSPPYTYHYFLSLHPPLYHFSLSLLYSVLIPHLGYLNSIIILRIISMFLGGGIIIFGYKSCLLLFDKKSALFSSFVIASMPMFISLSGSVSNEVLATFGSSLCIYFIIKSIRQKFNLNSFLFITIGTIISINTKISTIGLLPSAIFCMYLCSDKNIFTRKKLAIICLYLAISTASLTPWLIANNLNTGDILKWNLTKKIIYVLNNNSAITPQFNFKYLFEIITIGWKSYWGIFNAMRQPLNQYIYLIILFFNLHSILGINNVFKKKVSKSSKKIILSLLPLYLSIFLSYFVYNLNLFTPQGRYFFPLLIPLSLSYTYGVNSYSFYVKKVIKFLYIIFMVLLNGFLILILPKIIFPL